MSPALAPEDRRALSAATTFAEVSKLVQEVRGRVTFERTLRLGIASNIVPNGFEPFLNKHGLLHDLSIELTVGPYDDAVGGAKAFAAAGLDAVVFLPFFDNLLPSFEDRLDGMAQELVEERCAQIIQELSLAVGELKATRFIFVAEMHPIGAPIASPARDRVRDTVRRINESLRAALSPFPAVRWLDLSTIVSRVGHAAAFQPASYLRFKAPYGSAFWDELARDLMLTTRGAGGYYLKVLALDCDNTLWGGIVGEDGLTGIALDPFRFPGNIYYRVQQRLLRMQRAGVMLCLCSKNNPADVDEVLNRHPNRVISQEHLVAKAVGWNDKPEGLQDLSQRLGIGLDAFVFLDDSPFECDAVRSRLPEVRVVQVPSNGAAYLAELDRIESWFLAAGVSAESATKTEQYKARALLEAERSRFGSHAEFLRSLGLQVEIHLNDRASIRRIAELTQKTNQFNLTTRRYTETEIERFMDGAEGEVFSASVRDRFGDAGIVLLGMVRFEGTVATVDTFLMSCRVIGRGIERTPWPWILERCRARGCRTLVGKFIPTQKNALARDFYAGLGIAGVQEPDGSWRYELSLDAAPEILLEGIEVRHVL